MQGSKIRLSPAEAALFGNAEIILTKNRILQKTADLLAQVRQAITETEQTVSIPYHSPSPKISKGENYLGLPYVILDYPRISKGEDFFFIRSMFWWGNFFSSTLQVGGKYKEQNLQRLQDAYPELSQREFAVGVNADPWVHHFGTDNYVPVRQLSQADFAGALHKHAQIKIAASWPLSEWEEAADKLIASWNFLAGLIT